MLMHNSVSSFKSYLELNSVKLKKTVLEVISFIKVKIKTTTLIRVQNKTLYDNKA